MESSTISLEYFECIPTYPRKIGWFPHIFQFYFRFGRKTCVYWMLLISIKTFSRCHLPSNRTSRCIKNYASQAHLTNIGVTNSKCCFYSICADWMTHLSNRSEDLVRTVLRCCNCIATCYHGRRNISFNIIKFTI